MYHWRTRDMKLKSGRYWVFAFNRNSPSGGLKDLQFSFNTIEEFEDSILAITDRGYTEYQVLNTDNNFDFSGDLGTVTKWVCKNIGGEGYDEVIY